LEPIEAVTVGLLLLFAPATSMFAASPQSQGVAAHPAGSTSTTASQRAFLNKYCVGCHNERLKTAGLELDKLDLDDVGKAGEAWEKVIRKISAGEMPPPRLPRPDLATATAFVAGLENSLEHEALLHPNPGRVPVHRVNRAEYANSIRDLLALQINPRSLFVADDVDQHGFDNDADVLSVSPALLEQYISAARKISRLAIGDTNITPAFDTYTVPTTLNQESRVNDELPFNSRGGIAIHHRFPVDGEYLVKVRLRRQLYGYILGMGRPHQLEVRLNGKRVRVFTIGGGAPADGSPASFAGNIMADPKWDLYMHEADKGLEVRFPAQAGAAIVGVSFIKDVAEPEGVAQPREMGFGLSVDEQFDGEPAVDNVLIGGPYSPSGPGQTASRRRIFVCHPSDSVDGGACAKQILSTLARRAYRRPVTEQEIQTLLRFFEIGRGSGGFEAGIRLALERLLADPSFVFRVEYDPPNAMVGAIYRLSDVELASRLSFFMWSSIPDDELLGLAVAGKLKDPIVLGQQVRRMLADSRSTAIVDNFVSDWLELDKTRSSTPDPNLFPDFDENLRQAFLQETRLFVESQIREDRGIMDLLGANYTYVNERLARHYGIPNIYGNRFRRVTLSSGQRGGLLGEGSVLMSTSYPNRTSPVLRGKWLLDNVLGTPPPPPPPVPALKETLANGHPASIRERMEEHRKNPTCAVCHVRMDPLGFALENFDGIGEWREVSDGQPIDSSGTLPDGTKFTGVPGLRTLLLSRRDAFVGTFTEKLMAYALGRDVAYYDRPALRKISTEAAASDYRWSAIIAGIVKSFPFQMSVVRNAPSGAKANSVARQTQSPSEPSQSNSDLKRGAR